MRVVTVRIEDNTEKIENVKQLEKCRSKVIENISDKIDELQEEGFMQILAYIKCATEDYLGIVGETTKINNVSWLKNKLDVSNLTRSVRICADNSGVFIDFNYTGTPECKNTPPRMKADFVNGNIIISTSTRKGICDLMLRWDTIKPEFQNKIDEAYERKSKNIKNDVDELQFLLRVAENFKA